MSSHAECLAQDPLVNSSSNDIVITGISGRFPESKNIEEFKKHLFAGVDLVTEDNRRWTPGFLGAPAATGKLQSLTHFDASFFGVHNKQADSMDPELRMLLETTFEAIIDAGVNPSELRGSNTGVFVGVSVSESLEYHISDVENADGYGVVGTVISMFPNRLSFTFDLHGPSITIDTASSSSVVALQRAFESIRAGECTAAIVGGCHLCLRPEISLQLYRLGMLSLDGKCKTFDSSVDGYGRCETVGAIFIQKASAARRIYATIVGAKTNCDGYKIESITYPSGKMQKELIMGVYSEVSINPLEVSYVETHGTGTRAGDVEEMYAITEVFCKNRSEPLLVGSVKSNAGHAEPAAGICAFAKIILAMENRLIPANLHYKNPNKEIPGLTDGRLKVVTTNQQWNGGLIGLNSFGFGGSNAHVLLRSNENAKIRTSSKSIPRLVVVSGRTQNAVYNLLNKIEQHHDDEEFLGLFNEIHSKNVNGHYYRGYSLLDINEKEVALLSTEKRPVWFVYSGIGSQYAEISKNLMEVELFKNSILKTGAILLQHGVNLQELIEKSDTDFNNVLNTFVAITAIQIALTDVLWGLGIEADGIIGHSTGEIASGYADGVLTAEQTILIAYYRGRAFLENTVEPGAMASVGLTWQELKKLCPPEIFPVCHNSKNNVTISGPSTAIAKFVEQLRSRNIFVQVLNSSGYAFHSKYVATTHPSVKKYLQQIIPHPKTRTSKWISTSISEASWNTALAQTCSADYYVNCFSSPVLFFEAMRHVPENAITIEIAPHCILQSILKRVTGPAALHFSLMNRKETNQQQFFLQSIGRLFNAGCQPVIKFLYSPVSYPVSHGTPMINSMIEWDHSVEWTVADFSKLRHNSSSEVVTINLADDEHGYLEGHVINETTLFPAAGYLVIIWKMFAKLKQKNFEQLPVIFENVQFTNDVIMPSSGPVKFNINLFERSGEFDITQGESVVASGKITLYESRDDQEFDRTVSNGILPLSTTEIYEELSMRGYDYKGAFCGVVSSDYQANEGRLKWEGNCITFIDSMLQFCLLGEKSRNLHKPVKLEQVIIDPLLHTNAFSNLSGIHETAIYVDRDSGTFRSGGIEIFGFITCIVPVSLLGNTQPQLNSNQFIPLHQLICCSDKKQSLRMALLVAAQIVIENSSTTDTLKIVEVLGEVSLTPLLKEVFGTQPMAITDYYVVNPAGYDVSSLTAAGITLVKNVTEAIFDTGLQLLVFANSLRNTAMFKNTISSLENRRYFILLEEDDSTDIDEAFVSDYGLEIVCVQRAIAISKKYILLRKVMLSDTSIVVHASDDNFTWVDSIKEAMNKSKLNGCKIYLVAQNEACAELLEVVNSLRKDEAGNNIRCYLLENNENGIFHPSVPFYANQIRKDLVYNILNKDNTWGTICRIPFSDSSYISEVVNAHIDCPRQGDLSSLQWVENSVQHYTNHKDFCWIYYAPLNFHDVRLATGKILPEGLSEQVCPMGLEFSGRDLNGKRVMGILPSNGLATSCIVDRELLWEVPENWTLEEASTIPIAYVTGYYSLLILGRVQPGECVLIHLGASDIGQAAIAIALHVGCTVYTTTSNTDEKSILKTVFPQLGDNQIGHSVSRVFERLIMKETRGRGVDLVLNSLDAGQMQSSVRCLSKTGRFIVVGKANTVNTLSTNLDICPNGASFQRVLLEELTSPQKNELHRLLSEGIGNGIVQPLRRTMFSKNEVQQAFKSMTSGKYAGKIVIKVQNENQSFLKPEPLMAASRKCMDPNKVYILIEGLSNFGIELADWLISRGAVKIVLTTRNNTTTSYQSLHLQRWCKLNIHIVVSATDVTNEKLALKLITKANELGTVDGIFNLAAVAYEEMVENVTASDFIATAGTKVETTKYLDIVSRQLTPNLQYFVTFTSVESEQGNTRQFTSTYEYVNSAAASIIKKRRMDDLPGIAIQWGAIKNIKYTQEEIVQEGEVTSTVPQRIRSYLTNLDTILNQEEGIVSCFVLANRNTSTCDRKKSKLLSIVGNILGIKDTISVSQKTTFAAFGMDSLMLTDIKETLERKYNIKLNTRELQNLTFDKLSNLEKQMVSGTPDNQRTHLYLPAEIVPSKVIIPMSNGNLNVHNNMVFVIHGIEEDLKPLIRLTESVNVSMYGIQYTTDCQTKTITELAEYYIKNVETIQTQGPFTIIGYLYGGCIAFEMGLQLEAQGKRAKLVLVDDSYSNESEKHDKIIESVLVKQSTILASFASRFTSLDQHKIIEQLDELKTLEERVTELAKILSNVLPYSFENIRTACLNFYNRFIICENYKPSSTFKGDITLLKVKNHQTAVGNDFVLNLVCQQKMKVLTVEGKTRNIFEELLTVI